MEGITFKGKHYQLTPQSLSELKLQALPICRKPKLANSIIQLVDLLSLGNRSADETKRLKKSLAKVLSYL